MNKKYYAGDTSEIYPTADFLTVVADMQATTQRQDINNNNHADDYD